MSFEAPPVFIAEDPRKQAEASPQRRGLWARSQLIDAYGIVLAISPVWGVIVGKVNL